MGYVRVADHASRPPPARPPRVDPAVHQKDEALVERMGRLNVATTTTTTNVIPTSAPMTPGRGAMHRPLPTRSSALDRIEDSVTTSSSSSNAFKVQSLVELLARHAEDPVANDSEALAATFDLNERDVAALLAYLSHEEQ